MFAFALDFQKTFLSAADITFFLCCAFAQLSASFSLTLLNSLIAASHFPRTSARSDAAKSRPSYRLGCIHQVRDLEEGNRRDLGR